MNLVTLRFFEERACQSKERIGNCAFFDLRDNIFEDHRSRQKSHRYRRRDQLQNFGSILRGPAGSVANSMRLVRRSESVLWRTVTSRRSCFSLSTLLGALARAWSMALFRATIMRISPRLCGLFHPGRQQFEIEQISLFDSGRRHQFFYGHDCGK